MHIHRDKHYTHIYMHNIACTVNIKVENARAQITYKVQRCPLPFRSRATPRGFLNACVHIILFTFFYKRGREREREKKTARVLVDTKQNEKETKFLSGRIVSYKWFV